MKILALPSLVAFFIALLLLLEHVYGAENSSEEEEDDESNEDVDNDEQVAAAAAKKKKEAEDAAAAAAKQPPLVPYQPYLEDPWYFYKWPGFGQAEGVVARWPWWPQAVPVEGQKNAVQDDENNSDEEQDDEDDEVQDDAGDHGHGHGHGDDDHHPHHRKTYKQKPTAVHSVGWGPAVGKATWYGVLNAKVNSRSDLEDDDDNDSEEGPRLPLTRFSPKMRYSPRSEDQNYRPVWVKSYGSRP
ncbi:nucleolin [Folsomia candida]|uniref:nucleolin n=1 Tax=Folsomia candida TaxID=158441 RepID=UPI000B8FB12A|nr:nucleolin [Folsomia candida]